MGTYYRCPSCGNQKEGDSIYRCCNRTYCDSCSEKWLIKSQCAKCGGAAQYLGRIESPSSDDSSSDSDSDDNSSSDSDDDDDMDSVLSRVMRFVKAHKDTMSSEVRARVSEGLYSLNWSEYPFAKTIYDELNS